MKARPEHSIYEPQTGATQSSAKSGLWRKPWHGPKLSPVFTWPYSHHLVVREPPERNQHEPSPGKLTPVAPAKSHANHHAGCRDRGDHTRTPSGLRSALGEKSSIVKNKCSKVGRGNEKIPSPPPKRFIKKQTVFLDISKHISTEIKKLMDPSCDGLDIIEMKLMN